MAQWSDIDMLGLGGYSPMNTQVPGNHRLLLDIELSPERIIDPDLTRPGESKVYFLRDFLPNPEDAAVLSLDAATLLPLIGKFLRAWKDMVSRRVHLDKEQTVVLSAIKCGSDTVPEISQMTNITEEAIHRIVSELKGMSYQPPTGDAIPVVEETDGKFSTRF